jgi:UDP-N-acetylglucosamine--N-acetylmuramyl-(pentapeptide) pyrophosphoryl-undecaprenol N-acetylglucosamine transferase
VREDLGKPDRAMARRGLGLDEREPVVLVTGGSQGARALNTIVPQALAALAHGGNGLPAPRALQVLHLSGIGNDAEVRRAYGAITANLRLQVRPVASDMDCMYAAADLVICRGGGTTVAELTVVGRPAVIVPYPHHRDQQQLRNAEVLAAAGAAQILAERDLDAPSLARRLADLLADREALAAMGERARAVRTADPTTRILDEMGIDALRPAVDAGAAPQPWRSEGAA